MATTKSNSTKKKPAARKTAAKKPTSKAKTTRAASTKSKTVTKKVAAKKTTKKAPAKKPVTKKSSAKSTAKKTVSKKVSKPATVKPAPSEESRFARLRKWNIGLAILHAGQAVAVALLATDFSLPLRSYFLTFNEATDTLETASTQLVDVPLAWLIVAFFAMSSLAHLIIAGPWYERYKQNLKNGMNKARWIEYSLSASTMMVAIAFLAGVNSLSLMLSIFGLTAIMNLMGLVMEVHASETKGKPSWISYWIGCIAGILPWLVIGLYFVSNWFNGSSTPPTFVYVIYGSIFLAFNSFAINMYLQYKKKGKWADYLYGEKVYMILSLVAKSALAWQVFGGTLR